MFGLGRQYAFRRQLTNLTADRALLQVKAPTDRSCILIRAYVGQSSSETSLQTAIRLVRKSSAATVTAAVIATDVRPLDPNNSASVVQVGTTSTGYAASTAGTNSDTIAQEAYNTVGGGWLWLPVPEGRILVPAGGIIALEAVEAFTGTVEAGLEWIEI